jgi:hypothetical protein
VHQERPLRNGTAVSSQLENPLIPIGKERLTSIRDGVMDKAALLDASDEPAVDQAG